MKNTKECATIHIVNSQIMGGEKSRMEFNSECEFYKNNGDIFITYQEPHENGTEGARVFLKIQKNSVCMRRMGDFKSVLTYDKSKITDATYRTPFGAVDMRIKTSLIENKLSESGGSLKINYTLYLADDEIENEILLKIIKEQKI
ncbi:MAG: DUF1934 domain-containing protein [Clostridia bacterium]|nr:DUF1934 domain-containing protein [Clostridia bacterium]